MSRFSNRRWLIIPASEVTNVNFDQVLESSADSLRYSIDGTKTFVKYEVSILEEDYTYKTLHPETNQETTSTVLAGTYGRPSIYQDGMTEYNHEEILTLLATEEWTAPMEEEV